MGLLWIQVKWYDNYRDTELERLCTSIMLNQKFIELGEGYGDIYELCELISTNSQRMHKTFIFTSETSSGQAISLAAAFKPVNDNKFMPIYICREGIKQNGNAKSKRRILFEETSEKCGFSPVVIELKNSKAFAEPELFYQYVTGILRINHLLPPLQ